MSSTSDEDTSECFDLAIVGGGAGGVLAAIHALRLGTSGVRIALIEPASVLARGVAYATTHVEHLLNVPARRMSALDSEPDDFLDFLATLPLEVTREALAVSYAPRLHYGRYLRARLAQAQQASPAMLHWFHDQAVALDHLTNSVQLTLDSGEVVHAHGVVLAVGNSSRPLPARGSAGLPPDAALEAWDFDAIKRVPPDAELCIAGSGLSMVDTVLSLAQNGHRGRIHVVSRHALLPLPHTAHAVVEFDAAALMTMNLRQRVRCLRLAARRAIEGGLPWQAVMENVRPKVRELWCTLSHADQRRFLRHVVRYWDVHRHRIAPQVHAQLRQLQDSGQLQLHRGRLDTVAREGQRIRVSLRMRDRRSQQLDVDRIINATGVEMRAQLMRNPLLADLLVKGFARAGAHGIGLDTTSAGELVDADGRVQPQVMVMGSLRIGSLWESIAVPELRGQAEVAARQLLAAARG